jgi:uncharacterized protein YjiS (DUF1127 family)
VPFSILQEIGHVHCIPHLRHQTICAIDGLDERTLRDIGISRGELVTTASRVTSRQQYP